MFLRLLFVLLCALNIAVGAWLLLGQPYVHSGGASDPGVAPLKLLSEFPESQLKPVVDIAPQLAASASAAVVQAPPPQPAPSLSYTCLALGPFATPQDQRSARRTLTPHVTRIRSRQEQTSQTSGWWVSLPAAGDRAQALALAKKLGEKDIGDYFVVSSGEHSNTISLGLFKDPANARKRRDAVKAAGFPARMSERGETVPEYWLDLVMADSVHEDWARRLAAMAAGSHRTGCF